MALHHVVLTTPKTSPEKLTLTVVDKQQLPDIENIDYRKEIYCLRWTIDNGRRNLCVNFKTDTDNFNIVLQFYRNNLHLNDNEIDLKLTEQQSHLAKRVYVLSYIDIFFRPCIVQDETTVHK